MKGHLQINKIESQILNPLSPLLFLPWQVVYKYCDKSFINKPAFSTVPQLIKKIYCVGTMWFYRFACAIIAQA